MSESKVTPVAIDNFLGQGWPSYIRTDYGDYEDCRCMIHNAVECNVAGAVGCRGRKPGTLAPIAALYAKFGKNRACHATPEVRRGDAQLAMLAMKPSLENHAYLQETADCSYKYLHSSNAADMVWFGAGYCHLEPVRATARIRAARVLGPIANAVDVLRVFRVVGNCAFARVKLTKTGDNLYHITKDKSSKGVVPTAGADFVVKLMEIIVESDGQAKIGIDTIGSWEEDSASSCAEDAGQVDESGKDGSYARTIPESVKDRAYISASPEISGIKLVPRNDMPFDERRLTKVKDWLSSIQVAWPTNLDSELAVMTTGASATATLSGNVREHMQVLVSLGLDALYLKATLQLARCPHSRPRDVFAVKERYSKAELAQRFGTTELWSIIKPHDVQSGSKACRAMLLTFLGGLMLHCGLDAVCKTVDALKLAIDDIVNAIEERVDALSQKFIEFTLNL